VAHGEGALKFNKEMSARYGIMRRDCTNTEEIQWFDLPNHYVFHYANSWETKAANGDDLIVMYGCAMNDVNLNHTNTRQDGLEHPFLWEDLEKDSRGKLTKFVFNLTTGAHEMKQVVEDSCDFPLVDTNLIGHES
jgi:carotenoid cleavage dioxygenase-like enzyme